MQSVLHKFIPQNFPKEHSFNDNEGRFSIFYMVVRSFTGHISMDNEKYPAGITLSDPDETERILEHINSRMNQRNIIDT